MTKDAKNEQAKAPLPMESFFTRENANEGIELPLLLPDGTKTEHWLRIRGVDARRIPQGRGQKQTQDAGNRGGKGLGQTRRRGGGHPARPCSPRW